jgi:hypothetical protein
MYDWRFLFVAPTSVFLGPPLAHLNGRLAQGRKKRGEESLTLLQLADHCLNSRLFGLNVQRKAMRRELKQS